LSFLPVIHTRAQRRERTSEVETQFQHSVISGVHIAMPISSQLEDKRSRHHAVLFIHDLVGCWFSFSKILEHFHQNVSKDLVPMAMDIRGFNLSSCRFDKQVDWYQRSVSDILNLLREHGIDRVHLVGEGVGALLAWEFSHTHPDMTGSLTTLSSPHPLVYQHLSNLPLSLVLRSIFVQLPFIPETAISRDQFSRLHDVYLGRHGLVNRQFLEKDDIEIFKDSLASGESLAFWSYFNKHVLHYRFARKAYAKLSIPILQIRGDRDARLTNAMMALTKRVIPQDSMLTTVTIPNCSRYMSLDCPQQVSSVLSDFLRKVVKKSR